MKVTVLGAGGWGTTLAILLHYNGHSVTLWEFDKSYSKVLKKKHENITFLPGIKIPEEITISNDLQEACYSRNLIVIAVPSQFIRSVIKNIKYDVLKDTILMSVSKGIEVDTDLTVSQIIKDVYPHFSSSQIGVLSGPSHAEEVSRRIPTAVVAASSDIETSRFIQTAFMNSYFRVYSSIDILGVELGGAFKNVIAVGAGIIDGVGFGDNTKAAIMTRGIAEISRLGIALGALPETFAGLSGMGDLIVTCMSKHSRNRFVGEKIGSGLKLKDVLKKMSAVAEGVATSKSASQLAAKHNIETPITLEVYKVLFEDKDPIKACSDLMTREMKPENV